MGGGCIIGGGADCIIGGGGGSAAEVVFIGAVGNEGGESSFDPDLMGDAGLTGTTPLQE